MQESAKLYRWNKILQVDESIIDLAKRTAKIGVAIVSSRGARDDGINLTISLENQVIQPAELFQLADLMQF